VRAERRVGVLTPLRSTQNRELLKLLNKQRLNSGGSHAVENQW
jgi:hypothetical protein